MTNTPKLPVTQAQDGPLSINRVCDPSTPLIESVGSLSLSVPSGVVYSASSEQLRCNLAVLESGEVMGSHVNDEVDVLIIGMSGTGQLTIDGAESTLATDVLALIPRGCERQITATSRLTYLSVHARRD